jgi:hypothetical protein
MDSFCLLRSFAEAWVGSAVFWSTIAGMAIRGLNKDVDELNKKFKKAYEEAEKINFNFIETFKFISPRVVSSIYGNTEASLFIRILMASVSINIYMFSVICLHWYNNRIDIEKHILQVISEVSPTYYSIIQSPEKRDELEKALEHVHGEFVGAIPVYRGKKYDDLRNLRRFP